MERVKPQTDTWTHLPGYISDHLYAQDHCLEVPRKWLVRSPLGTTEEKSMNLALIAMILGSAHTHVRGLAG
jgi:hypothetical protein